MPYGGPPRPHGSPGAASPSATWALVLGILGVVLACACPFVAVGAGVAAIVLGGRARAAAAQGLAVGGPSPTAGIVLGWVGVGLTALAFVVRVVSSFSSNGF